MEEPKLKKLGTRSEDDSVFAGADPLAPPLDDVAEELPNAGNPEKPPDGGLGIENGDCVSGALVDLASVEFVSLMVDPPNTKPPDGGAGTDGNVLELEDLSFFKLSSYSVWTVMRMDLYRSNNPATSRNGSDSTAFDTADRKETLRPRRAVKYLVSTVISSSALGGGVGFGSGGVGVGAGELRKDANVLVAFDAFEATGGTGKNDDAGVVAGAALGIDEVTGGAPKVKGVEVVVVAPNPLKPLNLGFVWNKLYQQRNQTLKV